jgi:hypothetical protein
MNARLSAQELLRAVAAIGYFERASFDPGDLLVLIEGKLNLGRDRAIDLLVDAGLVQVQYSNDPGIHPKDRPDWWRITLTEAGARALGPAAGG